MAVISLKMIIVLWMLTLCIYVLVEALIQFISSRIRNSLFSNIFYWTMFAVSRFVFVAIDSCFVFEILGEINLWRNYILLPVMVVTFWVVSCTSMGITLKDGCEKRQREHFSNDNMNWVHDGLLQFNLRHQHLPLFDLVRLIYTSYRKCIGVLPYKWTVVHVPMLDSYPNDPIFPECSVMHSILLFKCDKCTKDNGFYYIQSSNLRRQGYVRYLCPFGGSMNETWFTAIYQRGLIVINVADSESQKCYSYDIRNGHFCTEFVIKPRLYSHLCWILHDDGEDLGQQRNSSSTYFRVIHQSGQGMAHYGQCLYEISEDKRIKNRHFAQLIPWPRPWQIQAHEPFITSTGQAGMQPKLRDATSNGEVTWKMSVVYDPKSYMLKAMPYMEELMETDRPLRLYAQRYLKTNDSDDLPCPSVLNEHEALVCRNDGTIWRTRFQPSSLKAICMDKVFKVYGKKLSKFTAKDWLQMTGVDIWLHFPNQVE